MRSFLVKKCCSFGVKALKMMIAVAMMVMMMFHCWCSFEGDGPEEKG
jgi:hypothetical protein